MANNEAAKQEQPHNWQDAFEKLWNVLTGRHAEITYEFDQLDIHVPSNFGDDPDHAQWKLNGILKIRTRELAGTGSNRK